VGTASADVLTQRIGEVGASRTITDDGEAKAGARGVEAIREVNKIHHALMLAFETSGVHEAQRADARNAVCGMVGDVYTDWCRSDQGRWEVGADPAGMIGHFWRNCGEDIGQATRSLENIVTIGSAAVMPEERTHPAVRE
jgi:hypothetical protein